MSDGKRSEPPTRPETRSSATPQGSARGSARVIRTSQPIVTAASSGGKIDRGRAAAMGAGTTPEMFALELDAFTDRFEQSFSTRLRRLLAKTPERLARAVFHGALNGGKRIRPYLVCEVAGLFGVEEIDAMPAAAAIECIHCYSLIHDDLPSMDNDDMRRGKPTVHKEFDEATAILAGDTLLTLAFEILSSKAENDLAAKLVGALARASGAAGMVGGQLRDLEAEGRFNNGIAPDLTADDILALQAMKTGALLRSACAMGAILGRADPTETASLDSYGEYLGMSFQIADDLLDHEGSAEEMGKAVGKDADAGKGTLISLLGPDRARLLLMQTVTEAKTALERFDDKANMLRALADFIAYRRK